MMMMMMIFNRFSYEPVGGEQFAIVAHGLELAFDALASIEELAEIGEYLSAATLETVVAVVRHAVDVVHVGLVGLGVVGRAAVRLLRFDQPQPLVTVLVVVEEETQRDEAVATCSTRLLIIAFIIAFRQKHYYTTRNLLEEMNRNKPSRDLGKPKCITQRTSFYETNKSTNLEQVLNYG